MAGQTTDGPTSSWKGCAARENVPGLVEYYHKIPATSTYKAKATPAYLRVTNGWLRAQRDQGTELARKKKCSELDARVKDVVSLFPDETELVSLAEECARKPTELPSAGGLAAGTAPQPAKQVAARSEKGKKQEEEEEEELEKLMQASILVDQAQAQIKKGLYGASLKACTEALALVPKDSRARMLCALSACRLGDAALARQHHGKLAEQYKKAIRQTCLQKNIDLSL